ncbi:hypothetical protein BDW16_0451 [Sphingomonas koreensis]|nr:hypothetical protein BDW16_0451 [Sphingomonas koreensis]
MRRSELWLGGVLVLLAGCDGTPADNAATANDVIQMTPEPANNGAIDNAATANVAVPANATEPSRNEAKTDPEPRLQPKPAPKPDKKPEPMEHPPGHEMKNMQ